MTDEVDGTESRAALAVVTGASSGIGFHLAGQLAKHDFDVVVCAEDAELAGAARTLRSTGVTITELRTDLSTFEGVEQLVRRTRGIGRPVDALVLNAGVAAGGAFLDRPLDDHLQLIRLDVMSVVHLAHRLLPAMVERGSGRVLVTSSVAATMPGPYYATYAAAKAFLQSFSEALRHELRDTGVTVTALQPGPTDTEFFERSGMEETPAARGPTDDPADVARQGFEALMAGKDHVVVGGLGTMQAVTARVLPERARAAVHAQSTKPRDGREGKE